MLSLNMGTCACRASAASAAPHRLFSTAMRVPPDTLADALEVLMGVQIALRMAQHIGSIHRALNNEV